jgi:hypothetical protein
MAGSPDKSNLDITQERIQERNALLAPVKKFLNLSTLRREQQQVQVEEGRNAFARIVHQYPSDQEKILELYGKLLGVQRAIGMNDDIVGTLVKDGEKSIFKTINDKDARRLLSLYYTHNVLHGAAEKGRQGVPPTRANIQEVKDEEVKRIAQVFGMKSLDQSHAKRINLSLVLDKVLDGKL